MDPRETEIFQVVEFNINRKTTIKSCYNTPFQQLKLCNIFIFGMEYRVIHLRIACFQPDNKGPVKLIQRVKIAHSFIYLTSKLFHPIIFSLSR